MTKPRRRPQLALDLRPRTRAGKVARKRGRKPTGKRRDPRHRTRPDVNPRNPVHVVLRVTDAVRNLRGQRCYRAIRGALTKSLARADFRVVHASIQSNHLHLLVEADDRLALSRGMQGFAVSAAKRLNRELHRKRGDVFAYRYHATPVTTPRQARNAIAYILNNWRHHGLAWRSRLHTDPCSSAYAFTGWKRARDQPTPRDPLPVVAPTVWLLTEGWRRGGEIDTAEVPGDDPAP